MGNGKWSHINTSSNADGVGNVWSATNFNTMAWDGPPDRLLLPITCFEGVIGNEHIRTKMCLHEVVRVVTTRLASVAPVVGLTVPLCG